MNTYTSKCKHLSIILCLSILTMSISGCYAYNSISPNDYQFVSSDYRIYKVLKRNGDEVEFINDSLSQTQLQDSIITGLQIDSLKVTIPLSDVKQIYIKRPSTTATVINVSIVSILVGGFIYIFAKLLIDGPTMSFAITL